MDVGIIISLFTRGLQRRLHAICLMKCMNEFFIGLLFFLRYYGSLVLIFRECYELLYKVFVKGISKTTLQLNLFYEFEPTFIGNLVE